MVDLAQYTRSTLIAALSRWRTLSHSSAAVPKLCVHILKQIGTQPERAIVKEGMERTPGAPGGYPR
jgi:hypothetical protein